MAMPEPPLLNLRAERGGKYRILAELGQGGTATVSLAVARGPADFSKLVVLKVMKSALLQERDFSGMFMNEARLAARLNHPNIVQTNEVFDHGGLPVIVMEYLEGQSLSSVLARSRGVSRLPLEMHLRIISDVLSGLHYSHELRDFDGTPLNVVHRDMSPHNVFVTFDGHVKLLDFGIAKLAGSHVETATGVIKGKLRYMSPEQITGEVIDRRADVFAVGVMLWEAAADARMWAGMSEATIMNHLLNGEVPTPKQANPEVDERLEAIIMKALSSEPADRHPSAAALQAELDDYLSNLGSEIRPRDIGKRVADMFEDVRTQTRRIIETQLSRVASLTDAEYAAAHPIELTNLALTQSGSTHLDQFQQHGKRPKRSILFTGLAIAILIGGAIGGALVMRQADAGAGGNAKTTPPPEPTSIRLRVTAFPGAAKIYLDDQLLPSNPHTQEMPKDAKKHTLRFEAAGYGPEQREVTFERDSEIVVMLPQLPQKPPTVESAKPGVKRPPVSGVIKSTKKPGCDPPFVVDARGVKRYKPECL
jgi:eukaryotic-like serine/threonine-protein kinase